MNPARLAFFAGLVERHANIPPSLAQEVLVHIREQEEEIKRLEREHACARCGHPVWTHQDFHFRPTKCHAKDEGEQCQGFVKAQAAEVERLRGAMEDVATTLELINQGRHPGADRLRAALKETP